MDTKNKQRLWFCSDYGIENKEIIKLLDENNETYYIVTHDKEGKWDDITTLLKRRVKRESLKGNIIYGIGLVGTLQGTNIANLAIELQDSGNPISVLEQVTSIIGTRMTLDEQFIAAYVCNGINGINELAKKLELSQKEVENITENILIRNHQAMGVSLEQEAEFARKIDNSMQMPKSDYERTVAIDTLLNRNDFNELYLWARK